MKLFVSNIDRLDLGQSASTEHRRRRLGGRFHRLLDLDEAMLPLIGLIFLAEAIALIELAPTVQSLLAGIGIGLVLGKSVIVWRERDGRELHPRQVRRIEISWVLASAAAVLVLALIPG